MRSVIEVGNVWSDQVVDIWILLGGTHWRVERRNIPLWNWMGSLGPTHPRLCADAYLFPAGFNPTEIFSVTT